MVKSKSRQTQFSNHFPIGLYTVSYQPIFPKGAKRKLRDEQGKLIFNLENTRIKPGKVFSKDEIDSVVKSLNEQKYKKVKKEELTIDLPRICPHCKQKGSPKIVKMKKRFTPKHNTLSSQEKASLFYTKLHYGHSTTKPETCEIGHIEVSPKGIQIKISKTLPPDCLGYRRRFEI